MKLRLSDDARDCYGQYVMYVASGKGQSMQKIHEELWKDPNAEGMKFAVVFDVSTDEYTEPDTETFIYCLDEILPEVVDYCGADYVLNHIGLDKVITWLERKGVKVK